MATVRMKKGDRYADIFDSPETIKQAQLDGYALVESKKVEAVKENKAEVKADADIPAKNTRTGRQ